jgi:type II secretion system protein G
MAFRKHLSGQKGFTLIELLVVVAILGILAGIAAPRVMDAINNARERKAEADLVVIRDALERFYLDYAVFPPNLQWLVGEGYLDPNTTFSNSYNNHYMYVVCLDPGVNYFTDYRLGDAGRTPGTWTRAAVWDCAGAALPPGRDPALTTCDYWAAAALAAPINATFASVTDPTHTVNFVLALVDTAQITTAAPAPAVGATWHWSYQGK